MRSGLWASGFVFRFGACMKGPRKRKAWFGFLCKRSFGARSGGVGGGGGGTGPRGGGRVAGAGAGVMGEVGLPACGRAAESPRGSTRVCVCVFVCVCVRACVCRTH